MHLTLLRHGIADAEGQEELRALTKEGREQIVALARQLKQYGEGYNLILSSPLLRARQTAEIFAEIFGAANAPVLDARLACGCHLGDLQSVLQEFRDAQNVLVAGHAPDLGIIASEVLGLPQPVEFQKGSALKLKAPFLRARQGALLFFIHPEMV